MQQVLRLLNQVFSPTLDAEGRRALNSMGQKPPFMLRLHQFSSRVYPGYVWVENHQIVGNVSIIPTKQTGRVIIANVAVAPDFRRRGIARELMNATLSHLENRSIRTVMLQVDVENDTAIRLYDDLDFDEIGATTYWLASPAQLNEISGHSRFEIRPLRKPFADAAYKLDITAFHPDLNWPDPIQHTLYRQSWGRRIEDFLNGRQLESWVIQDGDALLAIGSINSEWGRPHRLKVRIQDEWRAELTRPMVAKLIRRVNYLRRRHTAVEHNLDDEFMTPLLEAANFWPKRHLMTMKLNLK